MRCQPIFVRFLSPNKINPTMGKSIHFSGQPLYGQVIKLLDKSTILRFSRKHGGEHYIKRFDCWTHLVVMLYAVIMRFDSLREITASLQAEARKLSIWVSAQCLHAVHFPMPTNDVRRLYLSPFIVIYTPHTGMCFPRTAAKAGMLSG